MKRSLRTSDGRLDWEAARQRLAEAEPGRESPEAASRLVLDARALHQATVAGARETVATMIQVVSFVRGLQRYAVETRFVRELCSCGHLARVPGARPVLLGITNLRGDTLPVFDLAQSELSAGADRSALGSPSGLVVLGGASADLAFAIDHAEEITRIDGAALTEPHALGVLAGVECVLGIDGADRIVLDGEALIRERRIFVAKGPAGLTPERETP